MGRLVKKGDAPTKGQGNLLGFLGRAPLARADPNASSEPAVDRHRSKCAFASSVGSPSDARAAEIQSSAPDAASDPSSATDDASNPPPPESQRAPLRMADALMRIERAINGWERLFASHERARVDLPERDADRARRLTDAISTLRDDAYDHRLRVHAASRRARPFAPGVHVAARDSAMLASQPRGASSGPAAATIRDTKRRLVATAHALSLERLAEVGTCVLPRDPNEGATSVAGDPVASVSFDASGRRVALAAAGGLAAVLSADTLRETRGRMYEPLFSRRGLGDSGSVSRTLSSLAWSRESEFAESRLVATTSGESDAVEIIDVFANRTRTTVSASGSRSGFGFGSGAAADGPGAGLLDVSFCPGAGDAFVASSRRGRCYLWDARCAGGKPRAELVAPTDAKSPVHCVRVSPNGQTVFAGTGSGLVHVWDLRGGTRARAAAFSVATQNKVSRELLRSLDLTDLLGRVPTLRDGPGKVAKSAVHWMEQDPGDPGRLGFHLACGWSGVADLLASSGGGASATPAGPVVTHAHCPPPPWETAEDGTGRLVAGVSAAAMSHRRSAAWVIAGGGRAGTALAVGCPGRLGARLLDFTPTPTARHWVAGVSAEDMEAEEAEEAAAMEREMAARAENGDAEANAAATTERGALNADVDDDDFAEAAARRRRRARGGRRWPDEPLETSGHVLSVAVHSSAPDQIVAGSWGALCLLGRG